MKNIAKPVFYPATGHEIKLDKETRSKYWAVKSKNLMFTYFEVEPEKKFARHSHESEQMTYVLQGKLYFEIENKIYGVGSGDLISIPSFVAHAVWTEKEGAKAVDAWSPVNDNY